MTRPRPRFCVQLLPCARFATRPPLLDHLSPFAWAVAALVAYLIGVSKSGFAGALGGVGVPLLSTQMSVAQAAAVILPLLYAGDWIGLRYFARHFSKAELWRLMPGAFVGLAVGTLCFRSFEPAWTKIAVGLIAIGLTFNRLHRRRPGTTQREPGVISARWWSFVSAFTSMLAHAGGPPLVAYLGHRTLDKQTFVSTAALFFLIINLIKLLPYAYLGLVNTEYLRVSLFLLPFVPLGIWTGARMHAHISEKLFFYVFTGLLFASGVELLVDASLELLRSGGPAR